MQIVIDIDENLYTRLFDNGVDNYDDAVDMAKAIRKGTPIIGQHGTILKMLAEMDIKTLSIAYGYARCLLLYGVDVTEKWETASQQTDMLEKAYRKGRDDTLQMMEGVRENEDSN